MTAPRLAYNEALAKKWLADHFLPVVYHVYSEYQADPETERRQKLARQTWARQGWVELPIAEAALPRRWEEGNRKLPYLKDLFDLAVTNKPDFDIIVYTNSDICVSSHCLERLTFWLAGETGALHSFRHDFTALDRPLKCHEVAKGQKYQGTDLITFKVGWWKQIRDKFPDMLIGAEAWDSVMRRLIEITNPNGLVEVPEISYHEVHPSVWFQPENRYTLESQKYNLKLAKEWMAIHGEKPKVASGKRIIVVFPVCSKDIELAVRHADWLTVLSKRNTGAVVAKWNYDAVVSYDTSLPEDQLQRLTARLSNCFKSVSPCRYDPPPEAAWPQAPNHAFQRTAKHMATLGYPFLWLEADACVLRKDWLDLLQSEYDRCGKPLMGPLVPGLAHINGVAVYPADMATQSPAAMSAKERAFDFEMKRDMKDKSHDATALMQHLWAIENGVPNPKQGSAPARITIEQAKQWVNMKAAILHRVKDNSLIELLMEGKL